MAVHGSPLRKGDGAAQPCRMRALPLPMGEVPEAERAFLPSQSLRDSSPSVGAKGAGGVPAPVRFSAAPGYFRQLEHGVYPASMAA